eukprot:scaffold146591_cov39-Prasinocladus_malaysianus.AAC.1
MPSPKFLNYVLVSVLFGLVVNPVSGCWFPAGVLISPAAAWAATTQTNLTWVNSRVKWESPSSMFGYGYVDLSTLSFEVSGNQAQSADAVSATSTCHMVCEE